MRSGSCSREGSIAQAVREGKGLTELREHASTCQICEETLRVTGWLQDLARENERTVTVPGAETIWWRSQVVRRLCDQESRVDRQTRPLWLAQIGAGMVAAATFVVLLLSSKPMAGLIGDLSSVIGGSGTILAVGVAVSLLTGGFIAWQASEELR